MENLENEARPQFTNKKTHNAVQEPTFAFTGATWAALIAGVVSYNVGLFNATMQLNEKGYYFTLLLFGLFSAVSIQKCVRDKIEGLPVSSVYYGLSWFSVLAAISLLVIGLFNATLTLSEKGFYGMSYALSLFAAITVQKNIRDQASVKAESQSN